jgi:hypothetical protein
MPTLLIKVKINPYLPKKKDAKIGKKSWTPRVIYKRQHKWNESGT